MVGGDDRGAGERMNSTLYKFQGVLFSKVSGGRGLTGLWGCGLFEGCPVGVLLASAGSAWWEATTGGRKEQHTL